MKIVFQSDQDGNDEIHVRSADGSSKTNLTNSPDHDWAPDWYLPQAVYPPARIFLIRSGVRAILLSTLPMSLPIRYPQGLKEELIMGTFERLSNNKGTVSTTLGKALTKQVLEGQTGILMECIDLVSYEPSRPDQKHIRAGAAKVVETVAETRPDLVAPFLEKLLPACSVTEPQTRWMVMRTMGLCAHLNKAAAQKAIVYAEEYIDEKEGLILASSADLFLGDFGAISRKDAHRVFPILSKSMEHVIENEQDWLLEALCKVYPNVEEAEQETIKMFAKDWQHSSRKSTQQRAKRILKIPAKK